MDEHKFKSMDNNQIKTEFESFGIDLLQFFNEDSNRDTFEANTCQGLQTFMTKLFSSDYSVLSSKAHGNDKQVVYDLVRLAAMVQAQRNIFLKNLEGRYSLKKTIGLF